MAGWMVRERERERKRCVGEGGRGGNGWLLYSANNLQNKI